MIPLPALTDRHALADLAVSPVCVGLVANAAMIPAAYEAGINFFVTADMHWPLYEQSRRGLRDLSPAAREQCVVALVSYVTQPEFCAFPFHEAAAELGFAHAQVLVAGGAYGYEVGRRVPIYRGHRERNYLGARAIGCSFHDREAAREHVNAGTFDIAFVRYNPPHPKAHDDLFPHLPRPRKTLVYNFKSTQGWIPDEAGYQALGVPDDYWRPRAPDYYRFALMEPAVDGLLVALATATSVRELADALAEGPLDDDDRAYLLDLGELVRGKARVKPA